VVHRIVVADGARKQHDMAGLDREGDLRQRFPPLRLSCASLARGIAGAQRHPDNASYATTR
jgi:hypothetical protein